MEETVEMPNETGNETAQNEVEQPVVADTTTADTDNTANTDAEQASEAKDTAEPIEAPETESEEHPEVFTEPEVDYSSLSREDLVEALKNLLAESDVTKIKNRVAAVRQCFANADKEYQQGEFEKFIAAGGNKDEYQSGEDTVSAAFRNAYNTYRQRRQKHIDELEAAKQHNLEQKKQILEELHQLIDNDNESLKKTYDEFNKIQERWKSIGDVPRSEINDLWQNYHFLVEQFFSKVKINKEMILLDQKKNLEKKTQLCEKAEELIVETSITKAFHELQSLREQWREIGPVPSEYNEEIWTRFREAGNKVDERRREFYEQRKDELDKNLLAKQALVDKVNSLTEEKPTSIKQWNEVTAELDEMLKVWKTIGPVPREQNDEIWKAFKGKIDQFYKDKKQYFDTLKDEQNENYNKKVDLCLQAEAIAKREDWKKATEELLKLQEEWKQIGAVSRKQSDKIWRRFRSACDEFFNKKAENYNYLHGDEQDNLVKKEAILSELKSYSFGDDKEENLGAIKDFQRRWMEVGHVPMAEKQRLQQEFRGTIDKLFEQLKISAREAEATAYRERIRKVVGDKQATSSEKQHLMDQIEKLQGDILLWENNLGFLASSKQADLLKAEFDKKMQNARQEIALLQAKLRILNETEKKQPETGDSENTTHAE